MMNRSISKTSSNSKNLHDRELPFITLITGKEWRPSEKEFLRWGTSYPDIDMLEELRRMEDWFRKHPDRRKTERGMHAFVKAWLDQRKHGSAVSRHRAGSKRSRYQNQFNDFSLRQEYDFEELETDLLNISGRTSTDTCPHEI